MLERFFGWARKKPEVEEEIVETKVQPEFQQRVKQIRKLADKMGWREVFCNPNQYMIRFKKGHDMLVDVYYSKMTVASTLNHPRKGRSQLFRKWVSMELLERIFDNPRVHTAEGYYTKK